LLCGGRRHLELFPSAGAERVVIDGDLERLFSRLEARPPKTTVLASGDPCFFGIGPLLAERFGRENVAIHPRPGSVSLAFARLGLAWQDATVLTVHGRPIRNAIGPALRASKLAVLTDAQHTPSCIAQALLEAGMADCPAFVCERLGGPRERIHQLTLKGLLGREFDPLNVLILLSAEDGVVSGFGRPESEYNSERGQITKAEVRAVALSKLEPWRAKVCWDVGAGSGSVAIEAHSLMREGEVFAIERDAVQVQLLTDNVKRHRAGGVRIIQDEAPQGLTNLPDPDAVFIGGAGSELNAVLRFSAERLRPGGRLVANFALLESLEIWQGVAKHLAWPSELSQISISRAEALGAGTHLTPLAPVWVTRLTKPEEPV
jgi:precorrin-6B C5,15-methyltransferase / cobalt-precorrin-6B C5,C15-methyltransferase